MKWILIAITFAFASCQVDGSSKRRSAYPGPDTNFAFAAFLRPMDKEIVFGPIIRIEAYVYKTNSSDTVDGKVVQDLEMQLDSIYMYPFDFPALDSATKVRLKTIDGRDSFVRRYFNVHKGWVKDFGTPDSLKTLKRRK